MDGRLCGGGDLWSHASQRLCGCPTGGWLPAVHSKECWGTCANPSAARSSSARLRVRDTCGHVMLLFCTSGHVMGYFDKSDRFLVTRKSAGYRFGRPLYGLPVARSMG